MSNAYNSFISVSLLQRRGMTSSIDEERDNPGHEEAPDTAKKVTNLKVKQRLGEFSKTKIFNPNL